MSTWIILIALFFLLCLIVFQYFIDTAPEYKELEDGTLVPVEKSKTIPTNDGDILIRKKKITRVRRKISIIKEEEVLAEG
jgi:hypothetical protein